MHERSIRTWVCALLGAVVIAGCAEPDAAPTLPNYAPPNPHLADSVVPIGHVNSAQSTGMRHAGPKGPSETLSEANGGLTYTHVGPGHYGLAISPPYPNGKRVIWTNGAERISKLDYETLAVLDEYEIESSSTYQKNGGPVTAEQADKELAMIDALSVEAGTGVAMVKATMPLVQQYYGAGMAGVYYLLSAKNVLYVGGAESILAYADEDPNDPSSDIVLRGEWKKPASVKGSFNSMNMTYDGWLVSLSDDGWVVLVSQDFSKSHVLRLTGAEVAGAWNQEMRRRGYAAGAATWVRNGPAITEEGSIFIPSLQHVHKIVWNGTRLSKDPADGAWVERYSNAGSIDVTFDDVIDPATGAPFRFEGANIGSGSTASLMGFGDEDRFVVLTDGDKVMNMVLFWREEIPKDWKPLPNAPSRRIAGMRRADIGRPDAEAVQSDQSVVVGGYGAFVVNNSPASAPIPRLPEQAYVGLPGHHPDFTPHGVQKFAWNPNTRSLEVAWVNTDVSSVNCVPVVSNASNLVYTVGARKGRWMLQGLDWTTGTLVFAYETGSSRFNTQYSGVLMDQEGRILHTTFQGIVRYERSSR